MTASVVHLEHAYFFHVKLLPILHMTYSCRQRVHPPILMFDHELEAPTPERGSA